MIPNLSWRKSSRSAGNNGDCVEIGTDGRNLVAVRDSKNPELAVLVDVPTFIAAVKAEAFTG
ncbi:DUF397 domain-containing protein [Lentzea sp. E54]|uniref:DUF397 domain-containing protein n=1 Tax=Lentzea xerophila TaxID=3435883 RepID=UPI003DA20CFC